MVRLRYHFLTYQVLAESGMTCEFTVRDILGAIREKIQILSGDIGAGSFGNSALIKFYDEKSKIFVLRVSREADMQIRLAVLSVALLKKTNVIIRQLATTASGRTTREQLNWIFTRVVEQSNEVDLEGLKTHYADLLHNCAL